MGRNAQRRKERKMNNNEGEGLKMVAPQARPAVQITIVMESNGQINVNGPLNDKVLCYGLLEVAKDIVRTFKPQQVVIPQILVPPDLRGGGRG
jgi:hypothetical protein